ncbi:hypothetical protein ACFQ3Z_19490 [Streptomyces nogalater]
MWLLACSSVGAVADVAGDPAAADVVVSGPDALEAARACPGERVALALRPLGGRFPQPPPGSSTTPWKCRGRATGSSRSRRWSRGSRARRRRAGVQRGGGGRARRGPGTLAGADRARFPAAVRAVVRHLGGLAAGLFSPLAVGGSVVLCRIWTGWTRRPSPSAWRASG